MTKNSVYIEIHTGGKEVTLSQFLTRVRTARKRKGLCTSDYTVKEYKRRENHELHEFDGDIVIHESCPEYYYHEILEYREDDMFGYYYLSTGERACK